MFKLFPMLACLATFLLLTQAAVGQAEAERPREVLLPKDGDAPALRLWVYLPDAPPADEPIPCVFIAPAGTPLFTGIGLAEGDRPEHVPYVEAGMAVVAYALLGEVADDTDAAYAAAFKEFQADNGGVRSGRRAVDWALANLPNLDPDRLYAAGHSSAANVAFMLGIADDRIDAVATYAPEPDKLTADDMTLRDWQEIEPIFPGIIDFLRKNGPIHRAKDVRAPIFLFVAADDSVVRPVFIRELARAMEHAGVDVTYTEVAEGGHYDAMIDEGIPRAIAWFKTLQPATTRPATE